ncbi:MAG: glycosyltransferase family 4 protein [Elusimicrobiota bacterium]|nr:glycosyltransferase family 4 protein [Elusimicrobiota bacterium]
MKIALVHPTLDFNGGAEKLVMYLAKELQNLGGEVDIYSTSFNKDKCYPELNKDLNIHSLMRDFSYPSARTKLLLSYEFLLKIYYAKKLVKKIDKKYDLINCHSFPSTITAVKIKEQSNTPVVWFCHEALDVVRSNAPTFRLIKNYDKKIVEKIDEIITYPYNSEVIEELYTRKPMTVYSGVDVKKFENGNKTKIRKKYGIKGNVLLFVGQLVEDKRVQDLIYALEIVSKEIPNIRLIIAGDGRYKNNLIALTHELKLEDNVIFTNFVDEKELPDYYASADLFLNPAIKQSWGLATFEAMAAKTPVILSSDTGAAKVVQENNVGIILPPLQPKLWAEKIIELLKNQQECDRMADEGYKWVKDNMDWAIFARKMLGVFESVV